MPIMDDPELIEDFVNEANGLFDQLEEILDELEDDLTNTAHLEKFGQVIDRIMGAAKSIEANEVAMFCELGKIIGYKSSQTKEPALLNVVVAILFDAIDLLRKMVANLKTNDDSGLKDLSTEAFGTRLSWLSDKFKHIERASVAYKKPEDVTKKDLGKKGQTMDQGSIDDLMKALGL